MKRKYQSETIHRIEFSIAFSNLALLQLLPIQVFENGIVLLVQFSQVLKFPPKFEKLMQLYSTQQRYHFWSFLSFFGISTIFCLVSNFFVKNDTSAHTSYLAWNFGIGQHGSRGCQKFKHMIRAGFDANNAVCLLLKHVLKSQSVLIQAVPFEMERVRMFTPLFFRNICENNFSP